MGTKGVQSSGLAVRSANERPAFAGLSQLGCELLDLDGVATYSDLDDTHLEEAGHLAVAAAVEGRIRKMLV